MPIPVNLSELLKTRDINSRLDSYQTGVPEDVSTDDEDLNFDDEPQGRHSFYRYQRPETSGRRQSIDLSKIPYQPSSELVPGGITRQQLDAPVYQSQLNEALGAGIGESQYDSGFYPGMDVEHNRALEQSRWAKVGSGLAKGGITALATGINTTIGTVFGAGSALFELGSQVLAGDFDMMKVLDAGVNNWVSNKTIELQDWGEEIFPTYRTKEERSDKYQREWWKHMDTANFWGDVFLKNFGFTVGAMGGGLAWTRLIGNRATKKLAGDIMKGATAASQGDAVAEAGMQRAAQAIKKGTLTAVDAQAVESNILKSAKSFNLANANTKLFGSVIAALGEGNAEGLMARKEFMDDEEAKLQRDYQRELSSVEQNLIDEGESEFVVFSDITLPDGRTASVPILTPEGKDELDRRRAKITEKYNHLREYAEEQGDRLATTTMLLNLPILTTTNMVEFGRMFTGGWKTARSNANVLGRVASKNGRLVGKYAPKGSTLTRTAGNLVKLSGSEAAEEMAQGFVSSGTKTIAEHNMLSAYNNDGYDDAAIHDFRRWIRDMWRGGIDYLSDIRNWQEGALGALTGIVGMPGRGYFSGNRGGLFEAVNSAKEEMKSSRNAAEKLNDLVNNPDFQDRWHGYIRHLKYDNEMSDALAKDDEYAWHNADDKQIINDVMTFANADRLDDLNDIVESYTRLGDEDTKGIRDFLVKNGDYTNPLVVDQGGNEPALSKWAKNATDKELTDKVKKQANRLKKTIKEYKNMRDALETRAPQGSSPEFLNEMTFTAMQIKAMDSRYLQMFDEVMKGVENKKGLDEYLAEYAETDKEGNKRSPEAAAQYLERVKTAYERLLGGEAYPVALSEEETKKMNSQLKILSETILASDPELKTKAEHLIRLSNDRRKFYKKLQTLLEEGGQEKFDEQATTPEKHQKKEIKEAAQEQTREIKDFEDALNAYMQKRADEKSLFISSLEQTERENPVAKEFLDYKRNYDGFVTFLDRNFDAIRGNNNLPKEIVMRNLSDIFSRARSEKELNELPDNIFPTLDEFLATTSLTTTLSPADYAIYKDILRNAMRQYLAEKKRAEKKEEVQPKPKSDDYNPATTSTPQGYDASQPGSMEPVPAKPQSPEAKQIKDGFAGLAEGIKESLKALEDRNSPTEISEWLRTKEVADAFREYGKDANSVEEVIQRALEQNPDISDATKRVLNFTPTHDMLRRIIESYITKTEPVVSEPVVEQSAPGAAVPTPSSLVDDMADNDNEPIDVHPEEESYSDGSGKEKLAYYRTTVPEISTGEAKAARKAIKNRDSKAYQKIDLSDFLDYLRHEAEKAKREMDDTSLSSGQRADAKKRGTKLKEQYEGFKKTWNALKDRGAFDAINDVNIGDEIEFVIDPTFPADPASNPQILLTTQKNGVRQTLTCLSTKTAMYYGLSELRQTLTEQYRDFQKDHPNDVFVFGQKSKVWYKQPGLIEYNTGRRGDGYVQEKNITEVSDYSESAPIVFINAQGEAVVVRGDKDAARQVSRNFDDRESNKSSGKLGNLYYLAKAPNGKYQYIPIRLFTEHFKEENKNTDNTVFNEIRSTISQISKIVQTANNLNVKEKAAQLAKPRERLGELLDLHDIDIVLRDFGGNVGVALAINQNELIAGENGEQKNKRVEDGGKMFRPGQATEMSLVNYIVDLNRAIQIRTDEDGKIPNLDTLISSGILTTNATKLRPKGSDFYIDPWIPAQQKFGNPKNGVIRSNEPELSARESVEDEIPVERLEDMDDFLLGGTEAPAAPSRKQVSSVDEVAGKISTDEISEPQDRLILAESFVSVFEKGEDYVGGLVDALSELGTDSVSVTDQWDKFSDLFNLLLNDKDRAEVHQLLRKDISLIDGDVNMAELMEDYVKWTLSADLSKFKNTKVENVYVRIQAIMRYGSYVKNELQRFWSGSDWQKNENLDYEMDFIGTVPDIMNFSELPAQVQECLKAKGYDSKTWKTLGDEAVDKIALCASAI